MADSRTTPPPPDTVALVEGDPAPAAPRDDRSIGDLLSELTSETTTLVKQEIRLVKAEATQEAREAGRAIGAAAAGGAVAYAGLIPILIGIGWGLGQLFGEDLIWLGILIVGIIAAIIGYVMLKKGLDQIKQLSPPLDTTAQTLKEDKQWIKEETR
ncbi:phage holin family protein [Rubrivirga sp. S365]|uniref:Phage holin family protein n=1 Tax=Rubrivirga litoralis TaxID=3075598 RepID=A0ABU3BMR7_9BACT|nr:MULTISPECIES: phage holin family protein [unclassified Rubrivirga]MDT0630582.1 phage holin family protein [Rubrivirga sp. F394]MDT7857706.1 phage holin family protein [Rubrivirga sp. S365]